ncbi:unnamed protein product [Effrenium voratum]|uniref:Uncharacterized protein n=1 Tax=Effrenium voratum TaxID=2562239 RepID=A0AA36JJL3_9DINO|nr:unnamed protein product [Effrenium voratum]
MTSCRLKALRPDAVANASFTFRVHGASTVPDLPGKNQSVWTKWSCTAVTAEDTAALCKRFYGKEQAAAAEKWSQKFAEGTTWAVNKERTRAAGFKGTPASKFSCSSSPVDLEFTDKTKIDPVHDAGSIPARPPIRMTIQQLLSKDEQRVNVIGVVTEVGDVETMECRLRGGAVHKDVLRLRLQDETQTECQVSIWEPLTRSVQGSQGKACVSAVALYRVKLAVTGTSRSLSTTEDTVVCILEKPDSVSDREDELIKKAASLASSKADQSATRYQGSADVSGVLRVVCLRALSLAQEIHEKNLGESAWQCEGVVWELANTDSLISRKGSLWAEVLLRDSSGELRCFAAEKALLAMTGCADKEIFLENVAQDSLARPRITARLRRTVGEYVNVTLLEASPQFVVPSEPGEDAVTRCPSRTELASPFWWLTFPATCRSCFLHAGTLTVPFMPATLGWRPPMSGAYKRMTAVLGSTCSRLRGMGLPLSTLVVDWLCCPWAHVCLNRMGL